VDGAGPDVDDPAAIDDERAWRKDAVRQHELGA
jgi:hypothetical protein